ncbi:MAG: crotonase/enoyl-CoA hydratase family protein [Alphaproteobacteria bacterium]|nr:crotonase/enoyl-CoA hydratase family protein [Alphaproteobacteria bacterium]
MGLNLRQRIESRSPPQQPDLNIFDPRALQHGADQFTVDFDPEQSTLWCMYKHADRPCYTQKVLDQILWLQSKLSRCPPHSTSPGSAPRCLVWASDMDGVFNLGGDLDLFVTLIRSGDEDGLRRYAHRCVDTVYNNLTNVGLPLLNITLVQGDALGGGFEAALSSDIIIAERQSKFGLPEILFNLFPGMGAYSLLCRRLDGAKARQMILSGRLYSAEEMYELGIVDVLAEPGEGRAAVRRYIEQNRRRYRMLLALGDVRRRCQTISYEELIDVTDLWVDTALNLQEADLRRMERLVDAQKRRHCRLKGRKKCMMAKLGSIGKA